MTTKPRITITYCTQCSWMLRAAWMGQELLSTFGADLGEVALIPGTGGIFEIHVNGDLIWERKRDGGFPEAKVLKQKVRDIVWPERDLGHSDGHKATGVPASNEQGEALKGGADK
ncbi:SelT/SelW/SelH family protein [Candidatus Phyllobacterium onerii]|uniref:SelT/SelW/SelH family protein n=1 Tax=Candidatus Phyllobacterium onerii TaxID=3020828 RepID=UPI00232F0507|nr:SelT/SelW/SelH family protein [Phyllobacterium sp. IY22]